MLLTRLAAISAAVITQLQPAYANLNPVMIKFLETRIKVPIEGKVTDINYYFDRSSSFAMWTTSSTQAVQQDLFADQKRVLQTPENPTPDLEDIVDADSKFYLSKQGRIFYLSDTRFTELSKTKKYTLITKENMPKIINAMNIRQEDIGARTGPVYSFPYGPAPGGFIKLETAAIDLEAIDRGSEIEECAVNRPSIRDERHLSGYQYRPMCKELVESFCGIGLAASCGLGVVDVFRTGNVALNPYFQTALGFLSVFHIYEAWLPSFVKRVQETRRDIQNKGLRRKVNANELD